MKPAKTLCIMLVAASLAGCAADPYAPKQNTGAVAGAVAGGVLGAALGGRGAGSRLAGAAIGAAAGGLLGSAIGASLDEQDRQRAYAAEMQALESGRPALRSAGAATIRTTTAPLFPAPIMSAVACAAASTATRSMWAGGRKSPAAPPVAIPTGLGHRSADGLAQAGLLRPPPPPAAPSCAESGTAAGIISHPKRVLNGPQLA